MEQQEKTPTSKRLKIIIIILAVLLVLSAGGLAARYIYLQFFAPAQTTATVPDNLIGDNTPTDESSTPAENEPPQTSEPGTTANNSTSPTTQSAGDETGSTTASSQPAGQDKPTAVRLELYEGKPGDNQKFEAGNMLPGDVETKYFCVKAYHDADITLFFKADVTDQTKSLGDVLHIKVTHLETGKVLCAASFNEVNGKEFSELLKANGDKATAAYYQVDVSLDTAVGNEYQDALLKADFAWYVKDEGGLTPPPQTGDTTNLVLWAVLVASSLLLLIFLWKHRKEEGQHE